MPDFVDTNVWVYAYDRRDAAKHARAREVVRAGARGIWTSPQVMGELYSTLTRKLGVAEVDARRLVTGLTRLHVAPLEGAHVLEAMEIAERHQIAYWDALVIASARAAGCDRLLTEDLQDGAVIAGVLVENPFGLQTRRLAETEAEYGPPDAWDPPALGRQLGAYEAACRAAGMKPNAVHSYWDHARRFLDWRTGAYRPRGTADATPPVGIGAASAAALEEQASAYAAALEQAGLGPSTVEAYHRHAMFFVRWLRGEFTPGSRRSQPAQVPQPLERRLALGGRTWTRDDLYAERLDRPGSPRAE